MRHADKDAGGECEEIYRANWFLTLINFAEENNPLHIPKKQVLRK